MDVEKHNVVRDLSFDGLVKFVESYASKLFIQCLVQGNMAQDDVVEKMQQCVGIFQCEPLPENMRPRPKILKLPLGASYCKVRNLNESDVNSVVVNYYQIGMESDKTRAMISLLLVGAKG